MFRDLRALLFGCWALLAPARTLAEGSAASWLVVERDAAAENCPAAPDLARATEALLATAPESRAPLIRVEFARHGGVLSARLSRLDADTGARELSAARAECDTLAQAVATALALMLETRETEVHDSTPPEKAAVIAPARPPRPPRYEPEQSLGLELTGGAALGVVGSLDPFVEGGVAFETGAFHASLGGLWLPARPSELGPGRVDVTLLAVSTRACLRLLGGSLDIFACSGVLGGALHARAAGFSENFDETRPWLALPLELALSGAVYRDSSFAARLRAGATLLVPARRQSFSVAGLGTAVKPERVAFLLWLGLDSAARW